MGQGADGLLGGADDDRLRVAHAGLQPARIVARPREPERGRAGLAGVVADGIVDLGAGMPGGLEPHADFHPLDRLHRHDRLGQPAVEPLVPLGVRAQSERDALDADLDHCRPACRPPAAPGR